MRVILRPLCGSRAAVGLVFPGVRQETPDIHLHSVSVAIAKGKHPVPFRTRKLSPSAPMVLRGGPRGRVGRRRTCMKRVAPDVVERPSSLVWVVLRLWRLVSVAEGRPGAPRGRAGSGGNPRTSRGAKTTGGSGGYSRGKTASGGADQDRRTGTAGRDLRRAGAGQAADNPRQSAPRQSAPRQGGSRQATRSSDGRATRDSAADGARRDDRSPVERRGPAARAGDGPRRAARPAGGPRSGGASGGFRAASRTNADGESRGTPRTPSGRRPGRSAAGGDFGRNSRAGSGPRWAADDDGARGREEAAPREDRSAPGSRTRRTGEPGTTRPASGGYRGDGGYRSTGSSGTLSSGTRSSGPRSSGTRSSGPRSSGTRSPGPRSPGPRQGEAGGQSMARERGPRPGAGRPSDRSDGGQGSGTRRTPGDRAGASARDGGRERASWSARDRNSDSARGSDRDRGGERTWSANRGRDSERPGGGLPRAGRDEVHGWTAYEPRPQVPDSVSAQQLDPEARAQLNSLPNDLADSVARYLVAAGLAADPEQGYTYAQAAKRLAARVGVVREACGIAAYRTGQWAEALSELRAARRMTGGDDYLPLMADCERALGRLDRALALVREANTAELDRATQIELRIVESGIRRDQGLPEAAVLALQVPELTGKRVRPWSGRLFYAYADALLAAGRADEARDAFSRAAEADPDGETDAADRLDELDGIEFDDLEDDDLADGDHDEDGHADDQSPG